MKQPNLTVSTYDDVAAEYYDPVRHPTCANFAELSNSFLVPRLRRYVSAVSRILEVGAGRSTAAPVLRERGVPVTQLTLLDRSAPMLEYSRTWEMAGAHLLLGDACRTTLPAESFGLIVSAFGDSYNCLGFWHEVALLSNGAA
jgi:ubiquinone/menaquinone biosynthesis C-methylase UbiE